jgi:hypothetical protein
MRIRNFNVAGIARSNFEPSVNINESLTIPNYMLTIDVMNVCDGVNVSVVALRGVRGKRLQPSEWMRSPHACRAHHNVQGWQGRRRWQPVVNGVTAHHKQVQGGMRAEHPQQVLNNSLNYDMTTRHTHFLFLGSILLLRFLGGGSLRVALSLSFSSSSSSSSSSLSSTVIMIVIQIMIIVNIIIIIVAIVIMIMIVITNCHCDYGSS